MSGAALLRQADQAGIVVRLVDGKPRVIGKPSPEMLTVLREFKTEIIAILQGDTCRWCGNPLGWPEPSGVVEGTGAALHHHCYQESEVARLLAAAERVVNDADALTDPAELMLHAGGLT